MNATMPDGAAEPLQPVAEVRPRVARDEHGTVNGATSRTAHSRRPGSRVRSTNQAHATPITPATGVATAATSSERRPFGSARR